MTGVELLLRRKKDMVKASGREQGAMMLGATPVSAHHRLPSQPHHSAQTAS